MKALNLLSIALLALLFFSCKEEKEELVVNQLPTDAIDTITKINTLPVTLIGMDSIECGAEIISANNVTILSSGLCWSTKPLPSINDSKSNHKFIGGIFATSINNLLPGTAYYIRAYAQTNKGIAYGTQRVFATDSIKYGNIVKGGRLFYVFVPGDDGYVEGEFHGLVATEWVNNKQYVWSKTDTLLNASDSLNINSKANADKIITALGGGVYAANVCDSLVYGGFADWYMPNYREINLIKLKLGVGRIWCSTEFNSNQAYTSHFNPKDKIKPKTSLFHIVAIRKF